MMTKAERRERKRHKARHGMRVSGASVRNLPTGALHTYIVKVEGVGWFTQTTTNGEQAIKQARKGMSRYARKQPTTVERKD